MGRWLKVFRNFNSLIEKVQTIPPTKISVAQADDEDLMLAIKEAMDKSMIQPYLFGNKQSIEKQINNLGIAMKDIEIIHVEGDDIANEAVKLVSNKGADILMKGMIGSSTFLKAVVNKEFGLRTGRLLSHIAALEVPSLDQLIFVTDGGMNINPSLDQKIDILKNGIDTLKFLGYKNINVAILSAAETVSENMPSTIDAAIICKMVDRGQITGAIVDGPLALDNILDPEAALAKGINSPIAGKADIILVPNIETGNALAKSASFLSKGHMAGIVAGAQAPIVLSSRADSMFSKLSSIAISCLMSKGIN
ncbi:MAG: bifunctional enoyl-CoA hydratase/phosphate acetyltransferase [Tissierella sp.]|nr:bifunctional enoyl-CoA hydratase/phosphate acetyltransferase [Tissierella sp.]